MSVATLLALVSISAAPPTPSDGVVARLDGAIRSVAISPDGRSVAVLSADAVQLYDLDRQKELGRCKQGNLESAVYLRCGSDFVGWIGADRAVYRWKPGGSPEKLTKPTDTPARDGDVLSPDGQWIARVTAADRRFRLLSLTEKRPDRVLMNLPSGYDNSIVFAPDSSAVALSSLANGSVSIFDPIKGELIRKITYPSEITPIVTFAPDGRSLLRHDSRTQILESATGGERFRLPPDDRAGAPALMAWSGNGRLVARAYVNGQLSVCDTYSGKFVWQRVVSNGTITAISLSRDGKRLAMADGSLVVWSLPACEKLSSKSHDRIAWGDLADSSAPVGFVAAQHFLANPDAACKWFAEHLKSRPDPKPEHIAKLIADLDDEEFLARRKASDDLMDIGQLARPALESALKNSPSAEVRRRCKALLERLQGSSVPVVRLRAMRAVEVLERIGTPAAVATLKKLHQAKPSTEVQAILQAALARMSEP